MSKILENFLNENNQQSQINDNSPTQNNSSEQEPSLMSIISSVLTPLVPVLVSKLTGQKLSAMNTASNDQNSLQQLTPIFQTMVNTQNLLLQEIILLKKNDQTIANGFQNLRLIYDRKQIEFNQNQNEHEQ